MSLPTSPQSVQSFSSASSPHNIRPARTYKNVAKAQAAPNSYPFQASSFTPCLHDVRYIQGILANQANFGAVSNCVVYNFARNKTNTLTRISFGDDAELKRYLATSSSSGDRPCLQAFFCTIQRDVPGTSFACQVSLSHAVATQILLRFNISPQFLSFVLGEPNYWGPGEFVHYSEKGVPQRIEFFCQQPRWDVYLRQNALSAYMVYDFVTESTTYLIVSDTDDPSIKAVKHRLEDLSLYNGTATAAKDKMDPFLLHSMITHQSFFDSKLQIAEAVRYRLYDLLDMVDAYATQASDRHALKKLTIELHNVSQNTDAKLSDVEMSEGIVISMLRSHDRFSHALKIAKTTGKLKFISASAELKDSLTYLRRSIQSQKNWLLSYKNRKDTAMNLVSSERRAAMKKCSWLTQLKQVYNLVTQQDSETNTVIAREMKYDSSSMRTIAILTMIFLPGSYVSALFSMSFFKLTGDDNNISVSSDGWIYIVVTVPLTFLVLVLSLVWHKFPEITTRIKVIVQHAKRKFKTSIISRTLTGDGAGLPLYRKNSTI